MKTSNNVASTPNTPTKIFVLDSPDRFENTHLQQRPTSPSLSGHNSIYAEQIAARQKDTNNRFVHAGSSSSRYEDGQAFKPSDAQIQYLRKNNKTYYNPPADGNCLFHAFARHLGVDRQNPDAHREIRQQTARTTLEKLKEIGLSSFDAHESAAIVAENGNYSADDVVSILAVSYGVGITVIEGDGSERRLDGPDSGESKMTLLLNSMHYMLVQEKAFIQKNKAFTQVNVELKNIYIPREEESSHSIHNLYRKASATVSAVTHTASDNLAAKGFTVLKNFVGC